MPMCPQINVHYEKVGAQKKCRLQRSGQGLEELNQLTLTKLALRSANRAWAGPLVSNPGVCQVQQGVGLRASVPWSGTTA